MDNVELYHHGIKGMKWGRRLYQNKDGSLTALGRVRYRDPKERAQIKRQATVEAKKQAAKTEADKKAEIETKRKQLLKSTDAAELYKNRSLLTDAEINERINRINLEKRLSELVPKEKTKGEKFVEGAKKVSKTVNEIYAFGDTAVGKAIKKKLGIGKDEGSKEFDLNKVYKNLDKLSDKEVKDAAERISNANKIRDEFNKKNKQNSNDKSNTNNSNTNNSNSGGKSQKSDGDKKADLGKLGKSLKSKIKVDPDDVDTNTSDRKADIDKLTKSMKSKVKADSKVEFVDAELIDTGNSAVNKLVRSLASKVDVTESTRKSVIDATPDMWKDELSSFSDINNEIVESIRIGQDYWRRYLEET